MLILGVEGVPGWDTIIARSALGPLGGCNDAEAAYRPEKDHAAQLSAFAELLRQHPEYRSSEPSKRVKLVLVGGVRNEGDAFRVEMLKKQAEELKISVCTYSILFDPSLKY